MDTKVDDDTRRAAIEHQVRCMLDQDADGSHELYHDDAVLEFRGDRSPSSGSTSRSRGRRRSGVRAGAAPRTPSDRARSLRPMSATDDLIANNGAFVDGFDLADLARAPASKVAVVACMDARLDLFGALGLRPGDAHVLRNAGGVVTDDTIRSVTISQRLLGTEEVILVHHTDCGMLGLDDDEFHTGIEADVGQRPPWSSDGFADLEGSVRRSIERIRTSPFIPHTDHVRGFVYDVQTGALREVT